MATIQHNDGIKNRVLELADYFVQCREDDINTFDIDTPFIVSTGEHDLIFNIYKEDREKFRSLLKEGIIQALLHYKYDDETDERWNEFRKNIVHDLNPIIMLPVDMKLHDIKAEKHESYVITFNSDIVSVDEKETVSTSTKWKCDECGDEAEVDGVTLNECRSCSGKKLTMIKILKSESIQRVLLREPMDEAHHSTQQTFVGEIHGEYVGNVYMGDKKRVTGTFKSVPLQKKFGNSQRNMPTIDIINLEPADKIRTVLPTPELLDTFKKLINEDKMIDLMTRSFAYHIYGNKEPKLALLLSMIGGTIEGESRGSIHILLIGDPSTSKSETAKKVISVSHKAMFTTGKGSTGAGLVMGMEKLADGRLIPQMGPVALCHKGHVVIDEFDKMDDKDRGYLHEVMEQQMISFAKGGKYLRIPAQTTIIACANPSNSRWDVSLSLMDNIPFPASLLSRFDLKFRYLDIPNVDNDTAISNHVMKMRDGRPEDLFSEDDIMAFINHARTFSPKITPEAKKRAMDFYVQLRSSRNDPEKSIIIDHRQFEGLIRLSTAYAKFHFRDTVDIYCVESAIKLYQSSLESFGMDVGRGMTQASMVDFHAKNATNYGKRLDAIHQMFIKLDTGDELVVKDELITLIEKECLFDSEYKMNRMISEMEQKGTLTTSGNCYKWSN